MRRILVTGSAGFIGFHLSSLLLDEGFQVHGFDGMTDYYDVRLKTARHDLLKQNPNFTADEAMLEDVQALDAVFDSFRPEIVVHLAAQAGVRYSLENPGPISKATSPARSTCSRRRIALVCHTC